MAESLRHARENSVNPPTLQAEILRQRQQSSFVREQNVSAQLSYSSSSVCDDWF
jgi:hypothetical protein